MVKLSSQGSEIALFIYLALILVAVISILILVIIQYRNREKVEDYMDDMFSLEKQNERLDEETSRQGKYIGHLIDLLDGADVPYEKEMLYYKSRGLLHEDEQRGVSSTDSNTNF